MLIIPESLKQAIKAKLQILYGTKTEETFKEIEEVLKAFYASLPKDLTQHVRNEELHKFHHEDIILNVYANSIQGKQGTPLQVLRRFTERLVLGTINGIHILPFFPWDTDRGFSVLNYYEVDERNGSWDDFTALNNVFDILMVDCVVNHASIDNPIVQKALTGDPDYDNFVITYKEGEKPDQNDLFKITRPRPTPVLTQYYVYVDKNKKLRASFDKLSSEEISKGVILKETGWVWTTFSRPDNPDGTVATKQVDFNFTNPKLFLEFVKILLFYISKGTRWIRLDAIPYLWKEIGTSCIHLPETHLVIQILNDIFKILDFLRIVLVAEVNEAQEKVLLYLGKEGATEGDLVYLFTHFPLAVHAVLTGTAKYYMNWISSLKKTQGRLFISVLGTHDGMGLKPVGDWLPLDEKEKLQSVLINRHGVLPNYSRLPGGQKIIYELCATPWNLINETESDE
ncbi:MAG: alpha-amylase family glycosyl hydrolase, partial [Promethearchaeota archaeon]